MSKIISALPPLTPTGVFLVGTGEEAGGLLPQKLGQLTTFTTQNTKKLWVEPKTTLASKLLTITAKNPAEVGRQAGILPNIAGLPREVKAKSRIGRLIQYQVVTSAKSYFLNPNSLKQEPSFSEVLNLGAVDSQMAVLSYEENLLSLTLKVWDEEFLILFSIPAYILKREVRKFTLPVVKQVAGEWVFLFSVEENPSIAAVSDEYIAGVDLGRVEPYTLTIVSTKTKRMVAQYHASKRLQMLVAKRDKLNQTIGFLRAKSYTYGQLGMDNTVLETERGRVRAKRNRVMNKITWLIATEIGTHASQWSPRFVALEDLTWVNPKHGMSRWTHSKDQVAITHKLTRKGVRARKVSPRNSSQQCYKCGDPIQHVKGLRLVVCSGCSTRLDRDVNAANNIALFCLLPKRSQENDCTLLVPSGKVMAQSVSKQKLISNLTRKTRN